MGAAQHGFSIGWAALLLIQGAAGNDERAAKEHFARAEVHYNLGRFRAALEEYSKAYEAKALPELLFNIGQCHMELEEYERAIFFYGGYLRERPRAANRALVQDRLAEAQRRAQQEREAEAAQRAAHPVAPAESGPATAAESGSGPSPPGAAGALAPPDPALSATAPFYQRWWFWTAVAGGVLLAGGTVWLLTADRSAEIPGRDVELIDAR